MIIQDLSFTNNTIQVFAYEGFQYTISNPFPTYTLQPVSNSAGLNALYFTKNGNTSYVFGVSDEFMKLSGNTTESFVLSTVSGSLTLTSSNTVNVSPGRFLDGSGNSLSNNAYVFYKNEVIPPIQLVAPSFTLKTPTSNPALPPGLSFVRDSSSVFRITGIPSVTVPNSNYQIIGAQQSGGKVITTRINIVVSNERLRLNLSEDPIINNMRVGIAITPRVLTAIPPVGSSNVRYTFPALPDGIIVTDVSGFTKNSSFVPSDPSFTMIIQGTPTSNAVNFFRNFDPSGAGIQYTVRASVGLLSNTTALAFSFAETVLFDTPALSNNYVGVPVDPSLNFFRAQTYFTSNVVITDISSSSLPEGVLLNFLPGTGTARLSGTPSNAGSANYTIKAINSNGISAEITPAIPILNDFVFFSSPVGDICLNYILSRSTDLSLAGYYTSNVQFTATAASGRAVSLSAPALVGTGLSLDSNGLLFGIPSTITPLTDLVVTATVAGSPATATKTIKFAILNDVFTFEPVPASNFNFFQNIPITPFRFPVTTLSGRSIVNYSQIGFPDGLTINPAGFVSGTPRSSSPTAGNVTIRATTAYASDTSSFTYNLTPDSMIFVVPKSSYEYLAGDPVGTIDINGVTFSGTTVSNYDLSISPTYGLTLNSSNGFLSGTWTTCIPPQDLLPSSCNFAVTAQAGQLIGTLPMSFTANPVVKNAMLFVGYGNPSGESEVNSWMYATTPSNITQFSLTNVFSRKPIADIQFKNNNPNSNTILASGDTGVFRGTRLDDFSFIEFPPSTSMSEENHVSSLVNISGTSNWLAAGSRGTDAVVFTSSDDGVTWDTNNVRFITSTLDGRSVKTRDAGSNFSGNPYLNGGIALAYSSDYNVLMAGGLYDDDDGHIMLRSTDLGSTWSTVDGEFADECAQINMENPNVWVATGSSRYKTYNPSAYTLPATTIKYSTDQGQTWFDSSDDFTMFGYDLIYANGTWLATGVSVIEGETIEYLPEVRYSENGVNWIRTDLADAPFNGANTDISSALAPLRVGSMNFDGTHWNVFVNEETPENGRLRLYRHTTDSELETGWFSVDISGSFVSGQPEQNSNVRFLNLRAPKALYTGLPPTRIQLAIDTNVENGPVFTSPTITSYLLYQYMQIAPIQLSATGLGQIYFFLETADLPPGLNYNQSTNQITGAPVRIGQDTLTLYAKDDNGITRQTLAFTIVVPRIIRKQDGAGAYTSLLRQYTEVLGAQNARDNRVLPNQERALGEFMSPEAPDVVTQTVDPKCFDPRCLR